MLAEEQIIQKISSTGSKGLRKAELRKEFPQADTDALLQKLSNDGRVFIDKKGTAYHCWDKESYMQYLRSVDPRFRLTYEAILSLEQTVRNNGDRLLLTIGQFNSNSCQHRSEDADKDKGSDQNSLGDLGENVIALDSFKTDFDETIAKFSSSIGWVDFGKIKNDLCRTHDLDDEKFYSLVEQLMANHPEKYELSSGGEEGLTVRGLIHGFVRCI